MSGSPHPAGNKERKDRSTNRHGDRAPAADGREQCSAPARSGQECSIEARQNDFGHQHVHSDHDDKQYAGRSNRRCDVDATAAMGLLGKTLLSTAGGGRRAGKLPQAKTEHDDRCDDTEPRAASGVVPKKGIGAAV